MIFGKDSAQWESLKGTFTATEINQQPATWRKTIKQIEDSKDELKAFIENVTKNEEWNVNGSYYAIEGITSPDGRVLGKMAHSERRGRSVAVNIYGEQDMKIFESGVAYFK